MAELAPSASRWFSTTLLLAGVVLLVLSWTPIGRLATEAAWDRKDSAAYTKLVAEIHRLGYEDPESSGLTQEELAAQQKAAEARLDAMIEKLDYAKSRPKAWSRGLFWTGAGLAALGTLIHLHRQEAAPSDASQSGISSLSRSQQRYQSRDK